MQDPSAFETLRVRDSGPVLWVTLFRPATLNAIDTVCRRELARVWEACRKNPAVRCVVVTRSGRAFCSGADVDELRAAPEEVERCLLAHDAVVDCVVLGVEDAIRGEEGYAIVTTKAGMALDTEELYAWFVGRGISQWKFPRYPRGVQELLPRLSTGKIDRRQALRLADIGAAVDIGRERTRQNA